MEITDTKYYKAVNKLTAAKLAAFIKDKAPELLAAFKEALLPAKRELLLSEMKKNTDLRLAFAKFYHKQTGEEVVLVEWESAFAPFSENGAPITPASSNVEDAVEAPPAEAKPTKSVAEKAVEAAKPAQATATAKKAKSAPKAQEVATVAPAVSGHFVNGGLEEMFAQASGLSPEDTVAAISAASDELEECHVKLGVLLSRVQSTEHYLTLGYKNMREFVEHETTINYRKAMYLIGNVNTIAALNIPGEALEGVSWSALRYVTPVMTAENYKTLLDMARNLKQAELRQQVAMLKIAEAKAIGNDVPVEMETAAVEKQTLTISMPKPAAEVLDMALEKAKLEADADSKAKGIEVLAASYLADPTTVAPGGLPLDPETGTISDAVMLSALQIIKEKEGPDGAIRVLKMIGELWDNIDINVTVHPK